MLTAFRLLAKLRRLRGTAFDIFGRTAERRTERRLIGEYEAVLDEIAGLSTAGKPRRRGRTGRAAAGIRGFGHVKEANLQRAKAREIQLLARFRSPPSPQSLAAAE